MSSGVICSICGGGSFTSSKVLWPSLIAEWQLSEAEAAYIDKQQGCGCGDCGANLRVVALGDAVRHTVGTRLPLQAFARTPAAAALRVLDINGAVAISPALAVLPYYVRVDFPAVDLHALPYDDDAFDLIIHSDTLEHVAHPVRALEECRRTLAPGGRLCFTVPLIVGRLTRSRAGLPISFHGNPAVASDDMVVRTEFGADAWRFPVEAGFDHVAINHLIYPAAIAFSAWQNRRT
jgi:SAM-dependent methyltransferase